MGAQALNTHPISPLVQEVVRALENPKYVWRTIHGLARETSLPEPEIADVLVKLPSDVLISTAGPDGQLFTTREHYAKRQSTFGKILSVLSDTPK